MPKATRAAEALSGTVTEEDRQYDLSLRPARLAEYIGQTEGERESPHLRQSRPQATRGARSRSANWAAGFGKNHTGAHRRERNGRAVTLDFRAGY